MVTIGLMADSVRYYPPVLADSNYTRYAKGFGSVFGMCRPAIFSRFGGLIIFFKSHIRILTVLKITLPFLDSKLSMDMAINANLGDKCANAAPIKTFALARVIVSYLRWHFPCRLLFSFRKQVSVRILSFDEFVHVKKITASKNILPTCHISNNQSLKYYLFGVAINSLVFKKYVRF